MLETLRSKLQTYNSYEEKYAYLREYCQLLVLKVLDDIGGFKYLAFVGGTALRILYDLKRFSEDLDFCLVHSEGFEFSELMIKLEHELSLYNIATEVRYKNHKTVAAATIKFNDLLHQVGLSPHHDQKLFIKFEVDQNPPLGYNTQMTMISTEFLTAIQHFDLPSLFSGKLHALFCRKYEKGRDYYDLIWYLSKNIVPNFDFLNNAIEQTEKVKSSLTNKTLYSAILTKIEQTNFTKVKADISPFLMDPREIKYFEKSFFESLLEPKIH